MHDKSCAEGQSQYSSPGQVRPESTSCTPILSVPPPQPWFMQHMHAEYEPLGGLQGAGAGQALPATVLIQSE